MKSLTFSIVILTMIGCSQRAENTDGQSTTIPEDGTEAEMPIDTTSIEQYSEGDTIVPDTSNVNMPNGM